jgi:golgi apparatus protein 1
VQACANERDVFCGELQTGQARVFRCLAHNLGKADFGEACKKEVMTKLARRQQNWKLDVTLRKACKDDAEDVCSDVDHDADHAEMTRCLMKNYADISEPCQSEVCHSGFYSPLQAFIVQVFIVSACCTSVTRFISKNKVCTCVSLY